MRLISLAIAVVLLSHAPPLHASSTIPVDVSVPPAGMDLLVLSRGAFPRDVIDGVEAIGGDVLHVLPPRLVLARVPADADPVLSDLGVEERFDGPLDDATRFEHEFPAPGTYRVEFEVRDGFLARDRQAIEVEVRASEPR